MFVLRVRFHIIRNERIENVGKYQSCMVSKVRIIWKQTVHVERLQDGEWCRIAALHSNSFGSQLGIGIQYQTV